MVCIRRAWLVLGGRTLPLEDDLAGYATTELDLGFPEVRDVVTNRPSENGVVDRTMYAGSRPITANITTLAGGTMLPDEIATLFSRFMVPAARPELHFVLDRPGTPERKTTVRASGYGWPVTGKTRREIHLSWVASDPFFRDPVAKTATSLSGSSTIPGRTYPLDYATYTARIYPVGGGSPSTGTIATPGDVAVKPLFRIFGPITDPLVDIQLHDPVTVVVASFRIAFRTGFRIDPNHWVDVDSDAKTAFADSDPGQSVMAQIDWQTSAWPIIPPDPAVAYMNLTGDSTSGVTQVQATWEDGYLT